MEYQRKLRDIEYKRERKKDSVEKERRKIEKEDLRGRDRINKDHERKLKEISAKESNDRKDKWYVNWRYEEKKWVRFQKRKL